MNRMGEFKKIDLKVKRNTIHLLFNRFKKFQLTYSLMRY